MDGSMPSQQTIWMATHTCVNHSEEVKKLPMGCDTSQLLLLGKVEYGGGPIFKVVLEC